MRRLVRAALAALTVSLFAAPGVASAHTLASSTVNLVVGDDDVHGTITLAVGALDEVFGAARGSDVLAAADYAGEVVAYVDAHLLIEGADGTAWAERYSNFVRRTTEGIETVSIDLEIDPAGSDPSRFTIVYDAVTEAVPGHQAVLVLEGRSGTVSTPGVFTADTTTVDVGGGRSTAGMLDMIGFGFHHVLDGADHLLFLATLLLPAPFVVAAGRWRRQPGVVPAARKVVHVVSAFTVGHSLTLVATSLGWISVPSRPVEVLIAASVAVSAIHAIRPLARRGEPVIAATFGLVHGMAFAGILHDLGIQGGTSTLALLAFNLGIELAQLAAVAATFPSLYVISMGPHGSRVRVVGASVALVASIAWILDRLALVSNPLASVERSLVAHPWWVVIALGGLAVWAALRGRGSATPAPRASLHLPAIGPATGTPRRLTS